MVHVDKTNVMLILFLGSLLLIIYYMPSRHQNKNNKVDASAEQELVRFQSTVQKFVKSLGDMEQRLQKLEDSVKQIHEKQESSQVYVNQQKDNDVPEKQEENKPVEKAVQLDTQHKQEADFDNFVGEIKRDNHCFDSAEHGISGVVEIWDCHKQGGNQKFQVQEGYIRHKSWCLAVQKAVAGESVVLRECKDDGFIEEWQYHDRLLKAGGTDFCMGNKEGTGAIILAECNSEDKSQQWYLERTQS